MRSIMRSTMAVGILLFGVLASSLGDDTSKNKYVGTKVCSPCHKTEKQGNQLGIWEKSRHANAYQTLTTARADSIAKAKGLKASAAESKECLQCHIVTADASLFEKTMDPKDGVQCETCHGAGAAYKSLSIMKDRAKSIAAGMTEYKDEAAIEAKCRTCHNPKSPSFKEFNFKEMWSKIKHPVPKKG